MAEVAAKVKMMFSVQMVQMMVDMEPAHIKRNIIIGASVFGLSAVIFDGLYWARVDSIVKGQERYEDAGGDDDIVGYDVSCGEPWSDPQEAQDLIDEYGPDCGKSCRERGT